MRRKRPWTEEELHLLHSKYPTHGPTKLSKMMRRAKATIQAKAAELALELGEIRGYVNINSIVEATGLDPSSVRERALRSGFAKRPYRNWIVVPSAWADAYVQSVVKGIEADEMLSHYYDLNKVARIFGLSPRTISAWVTGRSQRGAQIMNRIKIRLTSGRNGRRYLFDPYDVEREAKAYRERGSPYARR